VSDSTHYDLVFGQGNTRVAACVTMAGIVAVLIVGSFMAIGLEVKQNRPSARNAAATPARVRVIGVAPRQDGPCEQQVWPNIAQRCLVRTDANATTDKADVAAPENRKLSPLAATTVNHTLPLHDDATDKVQEDTALPRRSDAINGQASADVTVSAAHDAPQLVGVDFGAKLVADHSAHLDKAKQPVSQLGIKDSIFRWRNH
jgi:hypothetical protein